MKVKMKRLRLCLLNPRNLSEKSGFSQLKDEVSTVSGECKLKHLFLLIIRVVIHD